METTPDRDAPISPARVPQARPAPRFSGLGHLDCALELVRFLRRECPWDREQTAESLVPHLLEETHEVVDAIHEGDVDALEGELGDLLLNLAFQIVVAEEASQLDAASVYARLEAKMVARHPHLFGDGARRDWEALKASEREPGEGVLSGLATGLDPLTKSYRIQERVAGVGFDWEDYEGAREKVGEELAEVTEALRARSAPGGVAPQARVDEELGDLLFAVVNLVRLGGAHPTTALARANLKFQDRFEKLERLARERGVEMREATLAELDALWDEVKRG